MGLLILRYLRPKEIMAKSEATVDMIEDQYRRGLITEDERYQK